MTTPLHIALACGGTGGHIFPGLATAAVLQNRRHLVTLWMAGKDVEERAVQDWSGPMVTVPAEGFSGGGVWPSLRAGGRLLGAVAGCRRRMKNDRPDVLLAMGSYASVGPAVAALRLGVPLVLHESNVLPGRAIRLLSRWAAAVAASFEETRFYLKKQNLVVTGMPLRRELTQAGTREMIGDLDRDLFTVLVMGGSRGSRALNEAASTAIGRAYASGNRIQVIHLAGWNDETMVRSRYAELGVPHQVHGFVQNMAAIYAHTDLVICRAGAATCAEITAFGVPALLVPYPYAAHNHQLANARALEKAGAADVVEEKDLGVDWLEEYIAGSMTTPGRLARMSAASRKRAARHGAEALADVVEQAARPS
jgi:UDP-N-acetylglucosamine--N-acetylmuramyl-(pentapeptide) pyrophosphoryl-undecaprenol N-acetylglucosamine transferase